MKNDNRVAVGRSNRRNRPAEIVAPDREIPGNSGASAWKHPMMTASTRDTCFMPRSRSVRRSAIHMTPDQMTSAPATTHSDDNVVSIAPLNTSPTIATGMEPMMIPHPRV